MSNMNQKSELSESRKVREAYIKVNVFLRSLAAWFDRHGVKYRDDVEFHLFQGRGGSDIQGTRVVLSDTQRPQVWIDERRPIEAIAFETVRASVNVGLNASAWNAEGAKDARAKVGIVGTSKDPSMTNALADVINRAIEEAEKVAGPYPGATETPVKPASKKGSAYVKGTLSDATGEGPEIRIRIPKLTDAKSVESARDIMESASRFFARNNVTLTYDPIETDAENKPGEKLTGATSSESNKPKRSRKGRTIRKANAVETGEPTVETDSDDLPLVVNG